MARKPRPKALLGFFSIFASIALAFMSLRVASYFSANTPGMWAADYLLIHLDRTGGRPDPAGIGRGFAIEMFVDALCWLVVIWSLYLLTRKLLRQDEQ